MTWIRNQSSLFPSKLALFCISHSSPRISALWFRNRSPFRPPFYKTLHVGCKWAVMAGFAPLARVHHCLVVLMCVCLHQGNRKWNYELLMTYQVLVPSQRSTLLADDNINVIRQWWFRGLIPLQLHDITCEYTSSSHPGMHVWWNSELFFMSMRVDVVLGFASHCTYIHYRLTWAKCKSEVAPLLN
jgi:hypothetical protein